MDEASKLLLLAEIAKLSQRFDEFGKRMDARFAKWAQQPASPSAPTPFPSPTSTTAAFPAAAAFTMASCEDILASSGSEVTVAQHLNVEMVVTSTMPTRCSTHVPTPTPATIAASPAAAISTTAFRDAAFTSSSSEVLHADVNPALDGSPLTQDTTVFPTAGSERAYEFIEGGLTASRPRRAPPCPPRPRRPRRAPLRVPRPRRPWRPPLRVPQFRQLRRAPPHPPRPRRPGAHRRVPRLRRLRRAPPRPPRPQHPRRAPLRRPWFCSPRRAHLRPLRLRRPWRAPPRPPWRCLPRSPQPRGPLRAPPRRQGRRAWRAPPHPPWFRPDPPAAPTSIDTMTLGSTTTRQPAWFSTLGHTHGNGTLVPVSATLAPSSIASSVSCTASTFPWTASVILCAVEDNVTTLSTRCLTTYLSQDNNKHKGYSFVCSQQRYITAPSTTYSVGVLNPYLAIQAHATQWEGIILLNPILLQTLPVTIVDTGPEPKILDMEIAVISPKPPWPVVPLKANSPMSNFNLQLGFSNEHWYLVVLLNCGTEVHEGSEKLFGMTSQKALLLLTQLLGKAPWSPPQCKVPWEPPDRTWTSYCTDHDWYLMQQNGFGLWSISTEILQILLVVVSSTSGIATTMHLQAFLSILLAESVSKCIRGFLICDINFKCLQQWLTLLRSAVQVWDTEHLPPPLPGCRNFSAHCCKLTVHSVVSKLEMEQCLHSEGEMWLLPEILVTYAIHQVLHKLQAGTSGNFELFLQPGSPFALLSYWCMYVFGKSVQFMCHSSQLNLEGFQNQATTGIF